MKDKKWFRIQSFALALITVLAVPFLYQNCGKVDFAEYQSANPDTPGIVVDPNVGIGVEVRNGAGTVVANGGSLCVGGADAAQSHTAIILIATALPADAYYCRRTRPSADNEFWNCEDARSLGGSSSGGFGRIPDSGDTLAALGYNNLSNGTYELEVSAEGETQEGRDWTTLAVPVSFVVQDCNSGGTTPTTNSGNVTTTTRDDGNPGPPENPNVTTTTRVAFPTCRDTHPLRSGDQRYNCGSWRYNTSANNLTNPSRSRCCIQPPGQTTTTTRRLTTTTIRGSTTTTQRTTTTLPPNTCLSWNTRKCRNAGYLGGMNSNPRQGVNTAPQCCVTGTTTTSTTTTTITDPCEALIPPTCGDTDCSQPGNQRFNCGSWTYKTSAHNVQNPSRSRCCINPQPGVATCADTNPSQSGNQQFSCGSGWRYNTSASDTTNPSRSRCCTRVTISEPTCGDTDTSQSGNQQFSCGNGWRYNTSASDTTNPSRSRCCTRVNTGPVMCSEQVTATQCHAQAKALIPGKECAGQTCTVNECCGDNCETEQINCTTSGKIGRGSWPWPRFSGSETVTDVINENTCCFTPRCEQRYNCRRLDTVPPTWDCSPNQDLGSHVRFTCHSGQEFKPQAACDVNRTTGAVECSAENCCGPSSSTSSTTSTTFTTPPTSIVIPPIDPPYNN